MGGAVLLPLIPITHAFVGGDLISRGVDGSDKNARLSNQEFYCEWRYKGRNPAAANLSKSSQKSMGSEGLAS